jgi:protein TonB
MGYQALLFCPDEKTARTVTQVLSELEFSVDASIEPFAVVKKLMGQHFDAIVVDCDNEQNATLLFKSARNSTSNQTSLAVAVVEGQAGVAKAFRIGANLVLTKPINVEQAKGTLRVARGLLRKGDPAKGVVPAPPSPTAAASFPPVTPATPGRVVAPQTPFPSVMPSAKPFARPTATPTAAAATRAASAASAADDDDDVIDINEPSTPTPNAAVPSSTVMAGTPFSKLGAGSFPAAPPTANKSANDIVPQSSTAPMSSTSAARTASAAAPARSPEKFGVEPVAPPNVAGRAESILDTPTDSGKLESSVTFQAPSFSLGGASAAEEASGSGGKKALIGVAAAVLFAAGLYVTWSQFHERPSPPKESPKPSASAPATAPAPKALAVPASPQPATELTPPSSTSPQPTPQPAPQDLTEAPIAEGALHTSDKMLATKAAAKPSAPASAPPAKSISEAKPAPQPIVVKNGSAAPQRAPSAASDATAAPSVLDIAPSTSGGSLSNLLSGPTDSSKPVLQALNVSQGVSQGLLIKKVQPNYPPAAVRMHVEGSVQLLATIGKTGNITAVKVQSGEPLLAQAALDAVKQWKYKPYLLNGDPVEIQTQVTINFKLPR